MKPVLRAAEFHRSRIFFPVQIERVCNGNRKNKAIFVAELQRPGSIPKIIASQWHTKLKATDRHRFYQVSNRRIQIGEIDILAQ